MKSRKLEENTTGASDRSWATRWITSITGWWKSWPTVTTRRSVNIRIPPRSSSASWLTMGKQVARFIAYPALLLLVLALVFGLEPSSNALPDDEPQRGKAQAPGRPQKKSPT